MGNINLERNVREMQVQQEYIMTDRAEKFIFMLNEKKRVEKTLHVQMMNMTTLAQSQILQEKIGIDHSNADCMSLEGDLNRFKWVANRHEVHALRKGDILEVADRRNTELQFELQKIENVRLHVLEETKDTLKERDAILKRIQKINPENQELLLQIEQLESKIKELVAISKQKTK